MHTPELPKQHKGQITNVAVVIAITSIVATIAVGLLPKKSGPESSSPALAPASVPAKQLTQKEIATALVEKLKTNPEYKPNKAERIALNEGLGIVINDGVPIPYRGDGKGDDKEE